MEVQDIRRELRSLESVGSDVTNLKKHWVKPLKEFSSHAFDGSLEEHEAKHVKKQLREFNKVLNALSFVDRNTERMQAISNAVVDMKLLNFQGLDDSRKMEHLSNKLLNDDFHSVSNSIKDVKEFDSKLNEAKAIYSQVNGFLHQKLNLEHSVALMDLPHKQYLDNLELKSHKHKQIVKKLGRHFVDVQKKVQDRKAKD